MIFRFIGSHKCSSSLMIVLLHNFTYTISSCLLNFFHRTNLRDSYSWIEASSNDKSSTNCSRYLSITSSVLIDRANSQSYSLALQSLVEIDTRLREYITDFHCLEESLKGSPSRNWDLIQFFSKICCVPLCPHSYLRTSSGNISVLSFDTCSHYAAQLWRSRIR